MLPSRWLMLLVYPHAVGATECLVGCVLQGIGPFDDDNLAVWDDRSLCDSTTVGCEVSAVTYPGNLFRGILWVSTSGTDGSSACTCNICDPYLGADMTTYMSEETSLWSRIHCYLAASESSGYDVSPCVAAIMDTGTLPCVDDEYETPTVGQFDCEENDLGDLNDPASVEECNWDGDTRTAQEMFSSSAASSSTTATGAVVNTNSCLVGCVLQGISPFDEDNLALWDNRGTCDPRTLGCEVSTVTYPGNLFRGILWASSWGTEGSSACTCNICDPYLGADMTTYMSEETSLWSRIHCYLAASESSGYDVSPCVAAIMDTGTLPCVDDEYETPTVGQFDCKENDLGDLNDPASVKECNWDGDTRMAQEMFSSSAASSSTTATGAVVNTNSCLVGCVLQGISPFDEDNLALWDNRGTCDPRTLGCEVSTVTYPGNLFRGILWASSWGTEGSSACTCNFCDPYLGADMTTYMSEETSLWSRIHCYLVATELSGYDVSPCVAAIVDTGTLPCVDDAYEVPTVGQFDCAENDLGDLRDSTSVELCILDGEYRSTDELYGATRAPSPLPVPTTAPETITSDTDVPDNLTPQPSITSTASPDPTPTTPSVTSPSSTNGPQTGNTSTTSPDPTPAAPSVTSPPSADGPQPNPGTTISPEVTPAVISPSSTNGPQTGNTSTTSPDPTPAALSVTSPPSADGPQPNPGTTNSPEVTPAAPTVETAPARPDGSTPPLEAEEVVGCAVGSVCLDNFCCHPDTSTCGRKYTFCQLRDFEDGPRCCSGVEDDPDALNVCSEDSVCDKPEELTTAEVVGIYIGIATGTVTLIGVVWKGYMKGYKCFCKWCCK